MSTSSPAGPDEPVVDGELLDDEAAAGRLDVLLTAVVEKVRGAVVADVRRLRERHPGLAPEDLARLVVKRGTRRVGWASFATGFGGLTTRAVSVPAVLALRAGLVLAVAEVHGELDDPDLKGHLVLVLGGDDAAAALRAHGVPASDLTKTWVHRNVPRETLREVNRVVSRKVLARAGRRSFTSVTKLIPVVGAGVGYVLDRSDARQLGERAIHYYGGR